MSRLDQESLLQAQTKLATYAVGITGDKAHNALLYVLNNAYSVNGVSFKLMQLSNLSPD